MHSLITALTSLLYSSWRPMRKYIFPKIDYHPIFGYPGKVDNPKINIRTYIPSKIPYIDHLNGPLDRHITNSSLYQRAWEQRKRKSYFNVDFTGQISKYSYRPIQEKRWRSLRGYYISSRSEPIPGTASEYRNRPIHKETVDNFYKNIQRSNAN